MNREVRSDRLNQSATRKALLLLLTIALSLCLSGQPVRQAWLEPATWTVDDDAPADFSTIQEAIDSPLVVEGDTVYVGSGIYREHVLLSKSVSLVAVGEGSTTVIDGDGTGTVVLVTADGAALQGFTVRNGSNGIIVSAAENCTISGNLVEDNTNRGILTTKSQNCTVSLNQVVRTRVMYGLNINSSRNIRLVENAASHNLFDGIGVFSSSDNFIVGNTVNDNRYFGIVVDYLSSNNVVYHNNFWNNSLQVRSSNPTNRWDNGLEGNYWSNYNGTDVTGDGVGEAFFVVDEPTAQRDRFPLMRPFVNEVYLRVDAEPPVASFTTSPETPHADETVSFDASDSYDAVGRNAIVSYGWAFGDGTTGTGVRVDHVYLVPGTVTVVLRVVDVAGNEGSASVDLSVRSRDAENGQPVSAELVVVVAVVGAAGAAGVFLGVRRRKKRVNREHV